MVTKAKKVPNFWWSHLHIIEIKSDLCNKSVKKRLTYQNCVKFSRSTEFTVFRSLDIQTAVLSGSFRDDAHCWKIYGDHLPIYSHFLLKLGIKITYNKKWTHVSWRPNHELVPAMMLILNWCCVSDYCNFSLPTGVIWHHKLGLIISASQIMNKIVKIVR